MPSALGASQAIQFLPAGSMVDFAGTSAPAGWLMCDGRSLPTASYPDLFSALSYSYGGSGANFSLPDFRGRFARYNDNMGTTAGAANRDVSARNADKSQGQATAKNGLTANSTSAVTDPKHSHQIVVEYKLEGSGGNSFGLEDSSSTSVGPVVTYTGDSPTGISVATTTTIGAGDSETRPINLSCNKIIKY